MARADSALEIMHNEVELGLGGFWRKPAVT